MRELSILLGVVWSLLCVYIDICMYIDNHLGHGKFKYLETDAEYTNCMY